MYSERSAETNVRGEGFGAVAGFATPFGCAESCSCCICVDLRSGCFRRPAAVGEAGVTVEVNCEDRAAWTVAYGSAY